MSKWTKIVMALCAAVGIGSLIIFLPQVREMIIGLGERYVGRPLTHEVWHERFVQWEMLFLALVVAVLFVLVPSWVERHLNILYLIIISLLALAIRVVGFPFLSIDMTHSLLPWFDSIRESGLGHRVGDYNLLYQTIIYVMTHIPLPAVLQYKFLSVLFDFALAAVCGFFCCELAGKKKSCGCFLFVYTAVLFLPTVFLNSGFWGQCDSIYAFFVISALYFLYVERTNFSFVMLGFAFAFKLQAVFIVPFYLYYYFRKKSFSALSFLIVPGVLLLSGLFCYIKGQNILTPIMVYLRQTHEYSSNLYLNIHSFFCAFSQQNKVLVHCLILAGIVLTASIFCGGMYFLMKKKTDLGNPKTYIMLAAWCVWACVLFLPEMHERYTYLLDILLILLLTLDKKFIPFAFMSESLSLITYANFLGGGGLGIESKYLSLLYVGAFICFSMFFVKNADSRKIEGTVNKKDSQNE